MKPWLNDFEELEDELEENEVRERFDTGEESSDRTDTLNRMKPNNDTRLPAIRALRDRADCTGAFASPHVIAALTRAITMIIVAGARRAQGIKSAPLALKISLGNTKYAATISVVREANTTTTRSRRRLRTCPPNNVSADNRARSSGMSVSIFWRSVQ